MQQKSDNHIDSKKANKPIEWKRPISKKRGRRINLFIQYHDKGNMRTAKGYVRYFYKKYHGRIAIGVGYTNGLSEIYPFVFQNISKESIGIVAIAAVPDEETVVYIYHLGAFESRFGNGSVILKELCDQADNFSVSLRVSPIVMPNGKGPSMDTNQLIEWYKRFGFRGNGGLLRNPQPGKG